MTLTDNIVKKIIKHLIKGEDYRVEVIELINTEFLQFAIDFFKKVIDAKLSNKDIQIDWYKANFLNHLNKKFSLHDTIINSKLNKKTITNIYNLVKKEIITDASHNHYDTLYKSINALIENQPEIDLTLTIKLKQVSVELNINESLIVVNTLAVKRAELRGGIWSTAGKQVEKNLMKTLCKLYNVPDKYFNQTKTLESTREVDFYLINGKKQYRCEVKLMGQGNPESADAIFARKSNIFIADKLSDLNKQQADNSNIKWVELRSKNGFKKFYHILKELNIPCTKLTGNLDTQIDSILNNLFKN